MAGGRNSGSDLVVEEGMVASPSDAGADDDLLIEEVGNGLADLPSVAVLGDDADVGPAWPAPVVGGSSEINSAQLIEDCEASNRREGGAEGRARRDGLLHVGNRTTHPPSPPPPPHVPAAVCRVGKWMVYPSHLKDHIVCALSYVGTAREDWCAP